jgi:AcrR family transcriptional regulator
MASPRRDGVDRRQRILDAALRCFTRHGVLATGIEEIRLEAKASPSSIYHHFGGLAGITRDLLVRTFERLFAHLVAGVTATTTAERAVRALVAAHVDWVLAHRVEARFMYQAMSLELGSEIQGPLQARKAELGAPIVAHVAPFITVGALPRWSPLHFEIVLLGPAHEACRRFLAGVPLAERWLRETLPDIAWRSIKPASKSRSVSVAARRKPRRGST